MKLCHKCGAAWVSEQRFPGRTETCAECDCDIHCCLNCSFYDPVAPNQCKSPTTELVLDKEKANFCDEFDFAENRKPETDASACNKSRAAWNRLFDD